MPVSITDFSDFGSHIIDAFNAHPTILIVMVTASIFGVAFYMVRRSRSAVAVK